MDINPAGTNAAFSLLPGATTHLSPWIISLLAAYVSLDYTTRSGQRTAGHWVLWIVGAGMAFGTGVWALHLLHLESQAIPFDLGYQPLILLAAWLMGSMFSVAAFLVSFTGTGAHHGRVGLATGLLTFALFSMPTLAMLSPGFSPGLAWHWPKLGASAAGAALVCGAALALWRTAVEARRLAWLGQTVAVALLAGVLWWSQWLFIHSVGLELQTAANHADMLPLGELSALTHVGSFILLLMMWLMSLAEARMRASLKVAESTLERQLHTDQLTGLYNRPFLEERLTSAVHLADQGAVALAVMFVNLDGFKSINESFGHAMGDTVLRETARRLRKHAGEQAVIARWGGDEFLVMYESGAERDSVGPRARHLLDRLKRPFLKDGKEVPMAASIGIALYPGDGAQTTLIAHAEAATRAAKASGGDTYCFFEAHMLRDNREQMDLLRDLRRAIEQNQLELYYQPKVHVPSGQITGAEALLRWNHPVRGLVNPAEFIAIAERFGLIAAVGQWVINEACRQIREWRDGGLRMRVAINLSAHQLRQPDLGQHIATALEKHNVNPSLLTCEITESVAMEDTDSTKAFFAQLESIGVHISIDDFGTGYSSLAYLRQLPAEELKIDRGFVVDLDHSEDARAVVDAVVKLGLALNLKVVAEGVETEAQYKALQELGCNELQGYLFAQPMSAKSLFVWASLDKSSNDHEFRPSLFGDTQLPPAQ